MSTCAESPYGLPGVRRPEGLLYIRLKAAADIRCRPRRTSAALHRVEQHALRPAQRADGQKTSFPYAVVDRPPRHAEQFGGVIERNAAADTGFESLFHLLHHSHRT